MPDGIKVELDEIGETEDYEYLFDKTMLGRFIRGPPVAIDEIRLSTVPINKTIACESAAQVVLQDNWCDVCARSEHIIFPASNAPHGSVSASSKEHR